jgi:hypothetical protein
MVHPVGLEPTTFGSEDQRSNPTELRVHEEYYNLSLLILLL